MKNKKLLVEGVYEIYLEPFLNINNELYVHLVTRDNFSALGETIGVVIVDKKNMKYYYSDDIDVIPVDIFGRGAMPIRIDEVNVYEKYIVMTFEIILVSTLLKM